MPPSLTAPSACLSARYFPGPRLPPNLSEIQTQQLCSSVAVLMRRGGLAVVVRRFWVFFFCGVKPPAPTSRAEAGGESRSGLRLTCALRARTTNSSGNSARSNLALLMPHTQSVFGPSNRVMGLGWRFMESTHQPARTVGYSGESCNSHPFTCWYSIMLM